MRKLMWFTIGFGAVCAGCAYLLNRGQMLILGMLCLLFTVSAMALLKRFPPVRVALAVFLGCTVGCGWFWLFETEILQPPRTLDGTEYAVSIEVSDYSYETDYGIAADGAFSYEGNTYRVRFYLNEQTQLKPGDRVNGVFRFRLTAYGGREEATYHSGYGIFLLAYPEGKAAVNHAFGLPLRYYPQFLRQQILGFLKLSMPEDVSAFAQALLLGEDTGIDYATNTAFSISGIRHVIAVSGLHVSILCAMLMVLTGKRPVLSAVVCGGILLLFAAVVGFSPSITRACVMMFLMLCANLLNREYDPPTSLAFAALVMLVVNPYVITSVSFQLSVGCMAGIFLFSRPVYRWLMDENRLGGGKGIMEKAARWFSASVSVTLGAISLTTPLSAIYFGVVSLVGVLTNLLTLWAISIIFYGIIAVCLLAAAWLPLGQALGWVIAWLIRYVLALSKTLAAFPLAAVYTVSDAIVWWLIGVYILLGIFLLADRKHGFSFSCIAVVGLCAALLFSWIAPSLDSVRMTVLDVGQGQCILLQSQGKTYMVDCGGDYEDDTADLAAETLLSQGITHLDGLILTHYDLDHAGAVENLLIRIPADRLYLPSDLGSDLVLASNSYVVEENVVISYDHTAITLFPGKSDETGNESSMCILFQTEKCDILITGDRDTAGEIDLIRQMDLPQVDVLVVGHHGSKTSTSAALLEEIKPREAIISVGAGNAYGHPAQEVLDRLEEYGCVIHCTDEEGTIIYRR